MKVSLSLVSVLLPLCIFAQVKPEDAQKKLDAMQQKAKGLYRVIDEKAEKQANGDVITTSMCFCDSMPGAAAPGNFYFLRRYGLSTKEGKKLEPVYDYIKYWENDQYLVKYREFGPPGSYEEDNWYVLVDRKLKAQRVYERDGIMDVRYIIKKGGKFGTVYEDLTEAIPFVYDTLSGQSVFEEVPILVKERSFHTHAAKGNKKWGIITTQNDTIVPFKYEYLGNLDRGRAVARLKGKWGIISMQDTVSVPFLFDSIYHFGDSYIVQKANKLALLNGESEYKKLEFQFDEIAFNRNGPDLGRVGGQWYFVKSAKIKPTDAHYDGYYFDPDSGPFVGLRQGNKWAIYGRGKMVTEFEYDKITDIVYERGQDYYEDGSLRSDYPVYRFKLVRDGKAEEFTTRD